jgi:hypothetical protein
VLADPAEAALDWLEGELADDGGHLTSSYDDGLGGIGSFDDWGLTIDATLALAAAGRGDEPPATTAVEQLELNVGGYVTGFSEDRYAGAVAKALLVAAVQGEDTSDFGGFDLPAELLARLQTTGPDAGRFSDASAFGDFSNGFGQALAILGLAQAGEPVPSSAVTFLLGQQCPAGGFRGDYTVTGGCTTDADATVDATAFALQALTTVSPDCAMRQAVSDAVAFLVAGQGATGSFGAESGSNANSTGLAAVALRSLGATAPADGAAGFVAGLQLETGAELGAIALNQAGFAAAADGIQVLELDGFRRASTQGVLAFDLPPYGQIGRAPIDPTAFAPCGAPVPPPGPPVAASSPSGSSVTTSCRGAGWPSGSTSSRAG